MKRYILLGAICILWSCKKDIAAPAAPLAAMAESMNLPKEGAAKVTLTCGGKALTVEGKCGGVVTMGEMIIAVQDKTVPQRVFTLSFNTDKYPESGKTYTIKKSSYMEEGRKPEGDVYAGFSEMTQSTQMDWSSYDGSGSVTFSQSGKEMRCTLRNIRLEPSIVYNKNEYNGPGIVSGELQFYRN